MEAIGTNLSASVYASGELLLGVNALDAGSAVVSHRILKESGRGFSSAPEGSASPTKYAVAQNCTNPFNPSTVSGTISRRRGLSRSVFDISGREITKLLNEVEPAGTCEVRFDEGTARSGGIASGVYFYTVRADSFTQPRKMVYIK